MRLPTQNLVAACLTGCLLVPFSSRAQDNRDLPASNIAGVYSNHSCKFTPNRTAATNFLPTIEYLFDIGSYPDATAFAVSFTTQETLEVTFLNEHSNRLDTLRFRKNKDYSATGSGIRITQTEFRKGGDAGFGRYKRTLELSKSTNGYLAVRQEGHFAGFLYLMPMSDTEVTWTLFAPTSDR